MPEIFVATTGAAHVNPVTREVRLDFEDKGLQEITIQLPLDNLRFLLHQAEEGIASYQRVGSNPDSLPLGDQYKTTALVCSKTPSGVQLSIHLQSETGVRIIQADLTRDVAAGLADDLLAKCAP